MDVEAIKQRATYSCIKCVLSVAVIGTYTDISAQEFLDVQVHVHAFSIRQWVSAWKPRLTVYWWYVGSFVLSTIHVHRTDSCTLMCMLWALQLVQCSVPNSMLLCFFFRTCCWAISIRVMYCYMHLFCMLQVDHERRKGWDSYVQRLETIDMDPVSGSEVVHWVMRFPVS